LAITFEQFKSRYRQKMKKYSVSILVPDNEIFKLWIAVSTQQELLEEEKRRR
jgi:hypothetical protein